MTADGERIRHALPHPQRIAMGYVPGASYGFKFGNNVEVDTGTAPEDVWGGGGDYTGQPTSGAETLDVYSDDTADTSAGTGARTVQIWGLDTDGYEQTETVTMDGTTHVVTSGTYTRCNRAKVLTAGTGATNAGVICIEMSTTSANVMAKVPIGSAQTRIACYTVPTGKTMLVIAAFVSIARASGANGSASMSLRARVPGGVYQSALTPEVTTGQSLPLGLAGGFVFTAGTDIKWRVDSVSDNDTIVSGMFEYLLLDD